MLVMSRRRIAKGLAVLGASVVLVGAGVFVGAGVATAAQQSKQSIGTNPKVVVTTETSQVNYTNTSWTTIATQYFDANAGSGSASLLLVRWTAESKCEGTAGWCSARILVEGDEALPASGTDFTFDMPGDQWESLSMERVGPHSWYGDNIEVKLQVRLVDGASRFRIDDWTLVTTAYK